MTYELIGDDSATNYFAIDSGSGQVTLRRSLLRDSELQYNLRVRVSDNGVVPRTDVCVVPVTINRNQNAPAFETRKYEVEILYTHGLGDGFVTVEATDADRQVSRNVIVPRTS